MTGQMDNKVLSILEAHLLDVCKTGRHRQNRQEDDFIKQKPRTFRREHWPTMTLPKEPRYGLI